MVFKHNNGANIPKIDEL